MKAYSTQTFDKYYVDWDTTNLSFVKLAILLEAKGIENHTFFLKLYNKKLRGVNPFDETLSEELRIMIFKECMDNRWYFFREVFRVGESGASTGVGGGVEFGLNRGNLAYLWAAELNISSYMILPRQMGKTWAAIADIVWTHHFMRNTNVLHFNKNQKDANENLGRISSAIKMLPIWMQHSNLEMMSAADKRSVKNNEKTIKNTLSSVIEAMSSAGNESKADAMARGRTASKIWYDELSFIFFNRAIWVAATPAFRKAKENALKNGVPFGISITTTPGDLATPHGAFAYKMKNDCINFYEGMYDRKYDKLMDTVNNTPDKMNMFFIQFNYTQLGKTDEWYIDAYKELNNPIQARREYLLEWINTNGNSPFDPDDMDVIADLQKDREQFHGTYKLNKYFHFDVYEEYTGTKPVVISVDVSTGQGRDASAVAVVNPETLKPMAFFKSNNIDSIRLENLLITLVKKKYPNSILTVENNSVGKPLLDHLLDSSIKRCIYSERKKKSIDVGGISNFTKKQTRDVIEYGHNVNQKSRSQMMETLMSMVSHAKSHLGFPEIYEELKFLEWKNGRIDHSSATHDDLIMAYMGALWVIRYGKGMKGKGIYFNISTEDDSYQDDIDYVDAFRRAKQALRTNKDDADAYIDYLTTPKPTTTANDMLEQDRREYLRELDRLQGTLSDDDDFDQCGASIKETISEDTERILLRNYNSLNLEPVGVDGSYYGLNQSSYDDDGSGGASFYGSFYGYD